MIEDKVIEASKKCFLCQSEIENSLWEKTKAKIKTLSINCIVCEHLVCSNCYLQEERFYPEKNKSGFCCKQEICMNKTRGNLKLPFIDLNPVYNIVEKQIPNLAQELNSNLKDLVSATSNEHLPKMFEELNKNISIKLEEIKNVFEEQKSKTKNDAKDLIEFTVNEKLPVLLEEIKVIYEEQKKNTTNDINKIIDDNIKTYLAPYYDKVWSNKYYIIFFSILGIFILCGLLTVEILMIAKYFK